MFQFETLGTVALGRGSDLAGACVRRWHHRGPGVPGYAKFDQWLQGFIHGGELLQGLPWAVL